MDGTSSNSPSPAGLLQRMAGSFAATALPLYTSLLNYRACNYENSDPGRDDFTDPCVFAFWHEYIAALLPRWGFRNLTLLVSQHRDAEWLNQTAARLGYRMARGSSTRGGTAAIRRLKSMGATSSIAITPDGPKGPRRSMAPGAIYVASNLGIPLVTVGVGLSHAHRLKTWDRFAIPWVGSRVRVIFGPRLILPKTDDRDELAELNSKVERQINELTELAQSWADRKIELDGYRPKGLMRQPKLSTTHGPTNAPRLIPKPAHKHAA